MFHTDTVTWLYTLDYLTQDKCGPHALALMCVPGGALLLSSCQEFLIIQFLYALARSEGRGTLNSPSERQLSRVVCDFRCKQIAKVRTLVSPTCTNFESLFQVSVYIAGFFHDLLSLKFEYRIKHPFLPTYCTWSNHKSLLKSLKIKQNIRFLFTL